MSSAKIDMLRIQKLITLRREVRLKKIKVPFWSAINLLWWCINLSFVTLRHNPGMRQRRTCTCMCVCVTVCVTVCVCVYHGHIYPLFGGFTVMIWLVRNVPFDCSLYRWRFQAPGVPAMWQHLIITVYPHVRQMLWHLVGHVTTFLGDNTWPTHLCYTLVSWHYNMYCYNTNTIGSVMSKWLHDHLLTK